MITCTLKPESLAAAESCLEAQRNLWTKRLDQLDSLVLDLNKREDETP